jgi:GT2 family glycosyltransferase
VSIVIATRNRREEVLTTVDRLLTAHPEAPIVVVDNGSSDGTIAELFRRFPNVETIALSDNRGAVARTIGVRRCSTPFVAFSDDDSWWAPGALDRAAAVLGANPTMGLLAARILVGPEEELDPTSQAMASSPLARGEWGRSILGFLACGVVVRRDAYLAAGGFPELIFFGGEEEVLALDLAAAGWKLTYVDQVVAHHHPSVARDPAARHRQVTRGWILSAWMRRPLGVALRRTVVVGFGRRGTPASPGAVLDALAALPAALRQRRRVDAGLEHQLRLLETRNSMAQGP